MQNSGVSYWDGRKGSISRRSLQTLNNENKTITDAKIIQKSSLLWNLFFSRSKLWLSLKSVLFLLQTVSTSLVHWKQKAKYRRENKETGIQEKRDQQELLLQMRWVKHSGFSPWKHLYCAQTGHVAPDTGKEKAGWQTTALQKRVFELRTTYSQ